MVLHRQPFNAPILEAMASAFLPEHVTPLALYMVHERFAESGKLFEAAAQWYGQGEADFFSKKCIEKSKKKEKRKKNILVIPPFINGQPAQHMCAVWFC